jgi:hypothetical protein
MQEFIDAALIFIEKKENIPQKTAEMIEVSHYLYILTNIEKCNKKKTIFKDFTASFFQHLTRLLGPKNILSAELSNMCDDLT